MKSRILSSFENLPYFTVEGYRQISGEPAANAPAARIALHRWAKAGLIIPLKKGLYMHRRFYEQHRREAAFSPVVSAILLPQSYLSLEFVLQQRNILTEITYLVAAVTLKNTRLIENSLGTFSYRHLRPDLYYGFQIAEAYGVPYAQASLPKALFDYLYLRPSPGNSVSQRFNLAQELRLDLDEFTPPERAEFAGYVAASGSRKMNLILKNLERTVWRP